MNQDYPKKNSAKEGMRPYLYMGLAAFLVIVSCITFFFLLLRLDMISKFLSKVSGILQPIIYGLVIAYLLNPIMTLAEVRLLPFLGKYIKKEKQCKAIVRSVSVVFALIVGALCIYILGSIIIPDLYVSIRGLVVSLPEQTERFTSWASGFLSDNSKYGAYIQQAMVTGMDYLENWMETELLPQLNTWISAFATGVLGVVNVLKNIIIGLIVSIYVLNGKEKFCGQGKMIFYAFFRADTANVIIDTIRHSNQIFSGFIIGKIIDSTIIGILCFIGCSLLNMPYALLVSVIVGVTNVIPFFGPYLGAIPSSLLILFVSPMQCLYFILFILVLQQVDGNIIGPTILGDSTGLSAFWVIFSILLGGGLFGILGMIIGVPTFAVIYYIIRRVASYLLSKKKMPMASNDYTAIERIVYEDGQMQCRQIDSPVEAEIKKRKEKREATKEKLEHLKDRKRDPKE